MELRVAPGPTWRPNVLCPHVSRADVVTRTLQLPRMAFVRLVLHSPRIPTLPAKRRMRAVSLLL